MYRSGLRGVVVLVTFILVLGSLASPTTAKPGEIPPECQNGGYANYLDKDGKPFKDETDCAQYFDKDGQPAPNPSVSLSFSAREGDDSEFFCRLHVTLTGFEPGTYTSEFYAIQYVYLQGGQLAYRDASQPFQPLEIGVTSEGLTFQHQYGWRQTPSSDQEDLEPRFHPPNGTAYWWAEVIVDGVSSGEQIIWC